MHNWTLLLFLPLAGCLGGGSNVEGCGLSNGTPDFCDESSWLNSGPLELAQLKGQVVLIDFWTYSCINCIRTLPHMTELYDTYAPHGLVVVGVHSPEFEFEKERSNVADAIAQHDINYPVVQDNDFQIWRNYENRYWPAHYLIDVDGKSVTPGKPWHIGEGGYEKTENKIRELLLASGATDLPAKIEGDEGTGLRGSDITPERYAGYGRQPDAIGNEEGYEPDKVVAYTADGAAQRDRIYFDGNWHNGDQAMTARTDGGFYLRFKAGAVNMVVEPNAADGKCIGVTLDGSPISRELAGADVSFAGDVPCVLLNGADSYDLYAGPVAQYELGIEAPTGLALYAFAFSGYAS